VPVNFLSIGAASQDGVGGYLDAVNFILEQDAQPTVLTTSYGGDEADFGGPLAEKLCNAFAALGARGVSVLFASGDHGVAGGSGGMTCETFVPAFPGTCP
jgi:tripeptidyl-peptidase-1